MKEKEKMKCQHFQVGKLAELDFVTAPHNIPGEEDQYGWWFSKVLSDFRLSRDHTFLSRKTKALTPMIMLSVNLVFKKGT